MRIIIFLTFLVFIVYSYHAMDYTIPPNTYSIQSGDFDNDGDYDIVVGHDYEWGFLTFLENIGNGEFTISYTMHSFGSITVYKSYDIDNEAGEEIITNYQDGFEGSKQIIIFYNFDLDNPFYYDSEDFIPFSNFASGDFDGDGDYDLVFSSSGAGLVNLWGLMYNLGNREFSEPEWFECPNQASNAGFRKLICRDIDENGFDDIIAYTNLETYIYYSNGSFFDLDSLNCYAPNGGMVSEDFDNDGDYDIIITHWPGGNQSHFLIYENIGEGVFTLHDITYNSLWGQPISVDVNDDGLVDIVNVGNINGIGIFYNIGNMQFDEVVYESVVSYGENYFRSSFSDFDNNGTQDVAIIRYGIEENNLTILFNNGVGNFVEEPVSTNNYQLPIANYHLTNFPNPFNPLTTISYDLPVNIANPVIEIFNIKGEKIKTFNCRNQTHIIWDGTDNYQNQVSSGVYLYRIKSDEGSLMSKKMLFLK